MSFSGVSLRAGGTHSNTGPAASSFKSRGDRPIRWEEVLMSGRGKEVPTTDQLLEKPCLWPVSLVLTDGSDRATA